MRSVAAAIAVLVVLASGSLVLRERVAHALPLVQTGKTTSLKPADLDKLLAPIALYPDQLLSGMLLCAENPAKIAALHEWLGSQTLTGSDLQDAAKKSGFEGSFIALVPFPEVVSYMASQMEWTTRLGQAFVADRKAVFASIQRLRDKARDAGKLKTTSQQKVETRTTSSGEQVIVIEPANPQVVYVPQYNATTVYTTAPTSTTTVVVQEDNTDEVIAAGLIGFAAGIAIGAAIDNDYYYGPYGWHGGFNMYDDAWDDWYDEREDAREDWYDNREDAREDMQDHRQDMADERGDRAGTQQQQRTERQENRPETQAQREERRTDAKTAASQAGTTGTASAESRGYSGDKSRTSTASTERSGTRSDAFSGYSSGKSERAASERGNSSRSSSRSGGSRRR